MRTIPDYSEWETLTLYFYRFLVRNSTNSYLSYYQIHKIYKNYFFTRFTQFDTRKKIRLLSKKVYTLIFQYRIILRLVKIHDQIGRVLVLPCALCAGHIIIFEYIHTLSAEHSVVV